MNELSFADTSSRTSNSSAFDILGCKNMFPFEETNIVKKFSQEEELLNDRFIPMRKASSLNMNCENEMDENN